MKNLPSALQQNWKKQEQSANLPPQDHEMGTAFDTEQEQKCQSFAWEGCFQEELHKSPVLRGL